MDDDSKKYRLDKTAFQAMTVQEADDYMRITGNGTGKKG